MQRYVDDSVGIELSYPASYRVTDLPCQVAQWAAGRGLQSLLYVSEGAGDRTGKILVALDRREFSVQTLQELYAHTGWVAPDQMQIGKHTFYYYGVGGGGVDYPDSFFYNLDGHILLIEFEGPYPPNDKTTLERTKQMELEVLKTLERHQRREVPVTRR